MIPRVYNRSAHINCVCFSNNQVQIPLPMTDIGHQSSEDRMAAYRPVSCLIPTTDPTLIQLRTYLHTAALTRTADGSNCGLGPNSKWHILASITRLLPETGGRYSCYIEMAGLICAIMMERQLKDCSICVKGSHILLSPWQLPANFIEWVFAAMPPETQAG